MMKSMVRTIPFYLFVFTFFLFTSYSDSQAQVTFTNNQGQFIADNPDLAFQDFAVLNLPPGANIGCGLVVNSNTNNLCFMPGDILPGLDFQVLPPSGMTDNMAFLGADILSNNNPPNILSADFLDQFIDITITPGTDALGMTVGCLRGVGMPGPGCNTTMDIDVYGEGDNLLGSTTVAVTDLVNSFIGINSGQPIERVALNSPPISNVQPVLLNLWFNPQTRTVPTLSEWGLIAMAGLLGMVGFMVVRRRQAAA